MTIEEIVVKVSEEDAEAEAEFVRELIEENKGLNELFKETRSRKFGESSSIKKESINK